MTYSQYIIFADSRQMVLDCRIADTCVSGSEQWSGCVIACISGCACVLFAAIDYLINCCAWRIYGRIGSVWLYVLPVIARVYGSRGYQEI